MSKPSNTNCENFEPLISAMIDGELEIDEQRELELHLNECVNCRAEASSYRELEQLVAQLSLPLTKSDAPKPIIELAKRGPGFVTTLRRVISFAVAASLLVALTIAAWPNPQPAKAEQVSAEQIIKPIKQLHFLNSQKEQDQELMLRTLGMDLRSLKLEVSELEAGSTEQQALVEQIDAMLQKVKAFE